MGQISIQDRALTLQAKPADPREDKYIENLLAGMPSPQAAREAGYSEATIYSIRSKKFSNDAFLARYVAACRGQAASILPKLHEATQRQLKHAELASIDAETACNEQDDPIKRLSIHERAVKIHSRLDGTQERIAKIAGLIKPDQGPPPQPVIAIGEVQNLLLQVSQPQETISE